MRVTIFSLILSGLCLTNLAHATETYSSQPVMGSASAHAGYAISSTANSSSTYVNAGSSSAPAYVNAGSNSSPTYVNVGTSSKPVYREHHRSHFSVSVNFPDNSYANDTYFIPAHHMGHHHRRGLEWLDVMEGDPMPEGAVIGGSEPNRPDPLFICRGNYGGGIHPGKVVAGRCNISWGGREIALSRYQVLASYYRLTWMEGSFGYFPPNAINGGYEHGRPLFICQAGFRGGMHPGKLVGQRCNIAFGGKEIAIPYYNVLVG